MEIADLSRYWGKAGTNNDCHPLVYHSLDVAAVAGCIIDAHHGLRQGISQALNQPEAQLRRWIITFAALHDLGKFSYRFQNLRRDLALSRLRGTIADDRYSCHHDSMGYRLWETLSLAKYWCQRVALPPDYRESRVCRIFDQWIAAACGHHGRPPPTGRNIEYFRQEDKQAAECFTKQILDLFLETQEQPASHVCDKQWLAATKRTSWWLSGLFILADWLGSNRDFFPYSDHAIPLKDYWPRAQTQARAALAASGIVPCETAGNTNFSALFPHLKSAPQTPLQQRVSQIDLCTRPELFIIEDVTGAGKTEAALMLTHRLMREKQAQGIYFALPTMATANAMFSRAAPMYRQLFAANEAPSVVLAHGARNLNQRFRELVLPATAVEENDRLPAEVARDVASAQCNAWLADGNKKALLAQVGIGTIDQALLAILPNRHQSLRLLGLFGKVLIVDEVHANDPYMHQLLCKLLEAHARSGGSTLLLSATLPLKMRRDLIRAYGAQESAESTQFPLLTRATAAGVADSFPIASPAWVSKEILIRYVTAEDEVIDYLIQAVTAGQCACWVRNTVADAREAWERLRGSGLAPNIDLFHARCAMGDRLAVEAAVLRCFGPDSNAATRQGRILIATQVVEQSLDLDFDVMVTDLAPMDRIIQRAGRLRRHTRSTDGDPLPLCADQRGTATLMVYGPSPHKDVDDTWLAKVLPRSHRIYDDHGVLWLTARVLQQRGGWRMPEDARRLIEGVYAETASEQIPDALQRQSHQAEGQRAAERSQAQFNAINLDAGYKTHDSVHGWQDIHTPTRLGEETTILYLARADADQLIPWRQDPEQPWAMSCIRVPYKRIAKGSGGDKVEALRPQLPGKGRWCEVLVLRRPSSDGQWIGDAFDSKGEPIEIRYDTIAGLVYPHEQ